MEENCVNFVKTSMLQKNMMDIVVVALYTFFQINLFLKIIRQKKKLLLIIFYTLEYLKWDKKI
jgi:hypothetical protein